MKDTEQSFPKRRRSASADAALRAEIERLKKMTMEERMRAALALGNSFPLLPNLLKKTFIDDASPQEMEELR